MLRAKLRSNAVNFISTRLRILLLMVLINVIWGSAAVQAQWTQIQAINLSPLSFGIVEPDPAFSSTVTIDTAGNRSSSGSIFLVFSGFGAADFQVEGRNNQNANVTLPVSATITRDGGPETMTVNLFTQDPANPILIRNNPLTNVFVGATCNISVGQEPGYYTGTFLVDIEYTGSVQGALTSHPVDISIEIQESILVPQFQVQEYFPLNFGSFYASPSGATATIDPGTGNRTLSAGSIASGIMDFSAAEMGITAVNGMTWSLDIPVSTTLTRDGGSETMVVDNFSNLPGEDIFGGLYIGDGAERSFYFGGRLVVSAGQEPGIYSGVLAVMLQYD